MKMKNIIVLCGFLLLGGAALKAQQIPLSINYLFRPGLMNPAYVGSQEHNNVHVSHQQRKVLVAGWRSISQFVHFQSQPLGRNGNWGYGVNLVNDIEHTENRFAFNGAIAVQAIQTEKSRFSLGGDFGIINWNSNYNNIPVFDRTDNVLESPNNFIDLDVGVGAEYELKTKKVEVLLSGSAHQLPGNFVSSNTFNALRLLPHGFLGGHFLFTPVHNVFVGPMAFYKNIIFQQDTTIQAAELDVGLQGHLARQNMWGGASYRINMSSLNLAFGMEVYVSDTAGVTDGSGLFVDLNAGFSYPLARSTAFGPSLEIGLDINFGRPYARKNMSDTLRMIDGAFWKNDGTLARHTDDFLRPYGPPSLRSETYVSSSSVKLDYTFEDQSLMYVGTTPDISGDSLKKLGVEWIGVDGFLEGLTSFVMKDALNPDSAQVLNPDSLEALKNLASIQLTASLQASEAEVNDMAEGTVYEGELGTNNEAGDTLFIPVVYNDADTVVAIALNHYITNLELACLKLFAMQRKLRFEMEQKYGEKIFFFDEGDTYNARIVAGRDVTQFKKIRVTPNHPNQEAFQMNEVSLKFQRNEKVRKNKDGEIIPDNLPSNKRKKKKKRNSGRVRERR